jgi:hypothetical protein
MAVGNMSGSVGSEGAFTVQLIMAGPKGIGWCYSP